MGEANNRGPQVLAGVMVGALCGAGYYFGMFCTNLSGYLFGNAG